MFDAVRSHLIDAAVVQRCGVRGLSRLCTAALLSSYGKRVVVCESHTQAGGCAHGFDRGGYKFDSGPSLFSGIRHRVEVVEDLRYLELCYVCVVVAGLYRWPRSADRERRRINM